MASASETRPSRYRRLRKASDLSNVTTASPIFKRVRPRHSPALQILDLFHDLFVGFFHDLSDQIAIESITSSFFQNRGSITLQSRQRFYFILDCRPTKLWNTSVVVNRLH